MTTEWKERKEIERYNNIQNNWKEEVIRNIGEIEKISNTTRNVDEWWMKLTKLLKEKTNLQLPFYSMVKAILENEDIENLDNRSLKCEKITIRDSKLRKIEDQDEKENILIYFLDGMLEISNRAGIDKMVKEAMKNMGDENSNEEFRKVSLLWEEDERPKNVSELPVVHKIYLVKKGRNSRHKNTIPGILLEHNTIFETKELEKNNLTLNMLKKYVSDFYQSWYEREEHEKDVLMCDSIFRHFAQFIEPEHMRKYKECVIRFINEALKDKKKMNLDKLFVEFDDLRIEAFKRDGTLSVGKLYDIEDRHFQTVYFDSRLKAREDHQIAFEIKKTLLNKYFERRDGVKTFNKPINYQTKYDQPYCEKCGCGHTFRKHLFDFITGRFIWGNVKTSYQELIKNEEDRNKNLSFRNPNNKGYK